MTRIHEDEPHVCTAVKCPPFARYYVSAIDAGKTHLMSGPYTTHAAALRDVEKALQIAHQHDGRAWFMAWGTIKMRYEHDQPGALNRCGLLVVSNG
jgi:hypothetical protein